MARHYVIDGQIPAYVNETSNREFVLDSVYINETTAVAVTGTAAGTVVVTGDASGLHTPAPVFGTGAGIVSSTASATGAHGVAGTAAGSVSISGSAAGSFVNPITGTGSGTIIPLAISYGTFGTVTAVQTRQYQIAGRLSFFVNETTDEEVQFFHTFVDQTAGPVVAGIAAGTVVVIGSGSGIFGIPITGTASAAIAIHSQADGLHAPPVTGSGTGLVVVTGSAAGIVGIQRLPTAGRFQTRPLMPMRPTAEHPSRPTAPRLRRTAA
jgi:hypothetical protein